MDSILESYPNGVTLVLPADPLSGLEATAFKNWMDRLLPSARFLVLDLARVEYVDSCGCGILLWLHRQLRESGGELAICALHPQVKALFEILRIERVLRIYPTRTEAVRALAGTPVPVKITVPVAG